MNIQTKFLTVMLSLVLITGMATIRIGRTVSTSIIKEQVGNHPETTAQPREHHIKTVLGWCKESAGMITAVNTFKDAVDYSKNHTEGMDELETVYRAPLGREERVIELKQEIWRSQQIIES